MMRKLLAICLSLAASLFICNAQAPQTPQNMQRPQGGNGERRIPMIPQKETSPQMHSDAPILMFRKTVAERSCYTAFTAANAEVHDTDVVLIGDSITDLWYDAHPDFFDDNNIIGRGIGGQTTIGILSRFRKDAVMLGPKVIVILAGINDIADNDGEMSLDDTMNNLASMCELALANGITPLLCSLTPCDRFSWAPDVKPAQEVIEMNKKIKEYASSKEGVHYVDYYSALDNGEGGLSEEYSKDGCHPTAVAYTIMEKIIVGEIAKVTGTTYKISAK